MKKLIIGLLIVAIIAIVGVLIYRTSGAKTSDSHNSNNSEEASDSNSQPTSLVSGDIIMPGAKFTIYYGNGCPHCENLEEWMKKNGYLPSGSAINQAAVDAWISNAKLKFNYKEIWHNQTNHNELSSEASKLAVPEDQIGVPFLIDSVNGKSYAGDQSIENYFSSL